MKKNFGLLAAFLMLSPLAFAEGVTVSPPEVRCSPGAQWDIDFQNGNATCDSLQVSAIVSNGVNSQKVFGALLTTRSLPQDSAIAHSFCAKAGYRSAHSFNVGPEAIRLYEAGFLLDDKLQLVRLLKRTRGESFGLIFNAITCTP